MKTLVSILTGLSTLAASAAALACPGGQHQECILPRPGGGCIQKVCVPDINLPSPGELLCAPVGAAGSAAYPAAADLQRARHDGGVPLHPRFRAALRSEFGDLVDRVRIHYSATQLDGIRVGDRTFRSPSDGQTFGLDIYINMNEQDTTLSLLAHELHHTRQWVTRGESLARFGESYFAKWCDAGFDYDGNPMERDAFAVGARFPNARLFQLPDPPPPPFAVTNAAVADFPTWAQLARSAVAGDFNGDGRADLALLGGPGWGTQPIAFGNGDGTFRVTNAVTADFPEWARLGRAAVADFNGDGRDDLALCGGPGWGTQPVAFSNGDGTFSVTNFLIDAFAEWAAMASHVVAGDFDGDGRGDLALLGGPGWGTIPVAFGRGDGTFRVTNVVTPDVPWWATLPGVKVAVGDLDGDGDDDIALAGGPGWSTLPVAFSQRDGSFSVTNRAGGDFAVWAQDAQQLLAVDVNRDRRADLVLTGGAGWSTLPIASSLGDGTFAVTNPSLPDVPQWARIPGARAVAGDFDGDGRGDVALTGGSGWGTVPVAFAR